MEKQNYECRKEFEEDLKGVKSLCCNGELISNSLGETICSNCGKEEEINIKNAIENLGTKKDNQIFLTAVQLNKLFGSKIVSIGSYGVFITF